MFKKSFTLIVLTLMASLPALAQQRSGGLAGVKDLLGLRSIRPQTTTGPTAASVTSTAAVVYHFSSVDFPGADLSEPFDVYSGTVVGGFEYSSSSQVTAFTFHGARYTSVPVPGSTASLITGINSTLQMVGGYIDTANVTHGFLDVAPAPLLTWIFLALLKPLPTISTMPVILLVNTTTPRT